MNEAIYKQVTRVNRGEPNIRPGAHRSSIRGGVGRSFIRGGAGRSFIRGGVGRSYIRGGVGRTFIRGGAGRSSIHGDNDNQVTIDYVADESSILDDNAAAIDDGESSIHGDNDDDRTATHVDDGESSIRDGAGQSSARNGNDVGQQIIIGNAFLDLKVKLKIF